MLLLPEFWQPKELLKWAKGKKKQKQKQESKKRKIEKKLELAEKVTINGEKVDRKCCLKEGYVPT
jgi:hypothetical protein